MQIQIELDSWGGSVEELRRGLQSHPNWSETEIAFAPGFRTRGIDPAVLVAIVGATGTGLGALLTGLLSIAQQSKTKQIVLQGKDGMRLEIPANTPPEEVTYWVEVLKKIDDPRVIL